MWRAGLAGSTTTSALISAGGGNGRLRAPPGGVPVFRKLSAATTRKLDPPASPSTRMAGAVPAKKFCATATRFQAPFLTWGASSTHTPAVDWLWNVFCATVTFHDRSLAGRSIALWNRTPAAPCHTRQLRISADALPSKQNPAPFGGPSTRQFWITTPWLPSVGWSFFRDGSARNRTAPLAATAVTPIRQRRTTTGRLGNSPTQSLIASPATPASRSSHSSSVKPGQAPCSQTAYSTFGLASNVIPATRIPSALARERMAASFLFGARQVTRLPSGAVMVRFFFRDTAAVSSTS